VSIEALLASLGIIRKVLHSSCWGQVRDWIQKKAALGS
jgi:hypothetical protein